MNTISTNTFNLIKIVMNEELPQRSLEVTKGHHLFQNPHFFRNVFYLKFNLIKSLFKCQYYENTHFS